VEPLSSQGADAYRDALAILGARIAEDYEGAGVIAENCNMTLVMTAMAAMLLDQLRDQGIDPAAWVKREQERPGEDDG